MPKTLGQDGEELLTTRRDRQEANGVAERMRAKASKAHVLATIPVKIEVRPYQIRPGWWEYQVWAVID